MSDEQKKSENKKPEEKKQLATMDVKGMLKKHGKAGTKINQNDRKMVKVVKATRYHTVGMILNPHPVVADQLIKDGIAEAYTPPKKK